MSNENDGGNSIVSTVAVNPMPVIGVEDLRQITIASDIFGAEIEKHLLGLLESPIFKKKVVDAANSAIDLPYVGEGTEGRLFAKAYDMVVAVIIGLVRKIG